MSLSSKDLGLSHPTDLTEVAMSYAAAHLPAYLMGHSARSFLFVRPTALARGLEPDRDYDEELVFLICLLHDLGLGDAYEGRARFEVEGADAARAFLLDAGLDRKRADAVWTGIALHTSDGIADRVSPEAGVAQLGIATDIAGVARDALPDDLVSDAQRDWPRLDLGYVFADDLAARIATAPATASPINFPGHVAAIGVPPGHAPTWYDMIAGSGWGDRPAHRRPGARAAAETPEQLAQLFLDRFRDHDLDGLAALYESGGVLGKLSGDPAIGDDAIRAELRALLDSGVEIELEARSAVQTGGLALISHTVTITAPGGVSTVVDSTEVARRQADGRWLYAIDDPFFTRPTAGRPHPTS